MTRRGFVIACGVVPLIGGDINVGLSKDIYNHIEAIQEHFFPKDSTLPSAKEFRAIEFLNSTIYHKSFDRDIRELVIDGAKEFIKYSKGKFLTYNRKEREKLLREYEESSSGANWLSRIMVLSIEALLSDPIYGGNFKKSGWIALKTDAGEPRPKSRYIFDD